MVPLIQDSAKESKACNAFKVNFWILKANFVF